MARNKASSTNHNAAPKALRPLKSQGDRNPIARPSEAHWARLPLLAEGCTLLARECPASFVPS